MHGFDAITPLEETMEALDNLVRSGKVRYIAAVEFFRLASDEIDLRFQNAMAGRGTWRTRFTIRWWDAIMRTN